MKRYCIKCESGRVEFLDVLRETDDGFHVRVVRVKDGYDKVVEEFLARNLFEICVKTGFIYETAEAAATVA
ncbi:MAG: hypothetical protein A2Z99_12105 [Treponema sp. GWB1_62_6]|nr:MAG: hypothetical protein A2Z99_12105 [Treponema sp. GWB1_62_6]OHE66575.1 MAG: hypothetical protein A2Y36_05335 [Treponema sp. GWA1_62_8]OHE67859.1 MAG: hypothetical protein A2001_20475 [Treponema sp. GWC1_61_84]OHE74163.1 MAG: hypothetical protein A2413_17820 [Treponema sp. RIFOXYC1_FULL_61_9]HCM27290.1 hypothetical protein [Treponema sp.]